MHTWGDGGTHEGEDADTLREDGYRELDYMWCPMSWERSMKIEMGGAEDAQRRSTPSSISA